MRTIGEALAKARAALAAAGVENAALDARLLLANAAGLDMAALIAESAGPLAPLAAATFDDHVQRRGRGEPVSRILGEIEFFGLEFSLGPATLVPRPETETLVEIALSEARRRGSRLTIADLGAGSGAIIVALLSELPDAKGVAIDLSADALAIARKNAERHGVADRITFRVADFALAPLVRFDIVVSNPPYVARAVIETLPREVREHDPRLALDGGGDGLAAYRAILARAASLLAPGGFLAFEIGFDQGDAVAALCRAAGLSNVRIDTDLEARPRVVSGFENMFGSNRSPAKKALGKVE